MSLNCDPDPYPILSPSSPEPNSSLLGARKFQFIIIIIISIIDCVVTFGGEQDLMLLPLRFQPHPTPATSFLSYCTSYLSCVALAWPSLLLIIYPLCVRWIMTRRRVKVIIIHIIKDDVESSSSRTTSCYAIRGHQDVDYNVQICRRTAALLIESNQLIRYDLAGTSKAKNSNATLFHFAGAPCLLWLPTQDPIIYPRWSEWYRQVDMASSSPEQGQLSAEWEIGLSGTLA